MHPPPQVWGLTDGLHRRSLMCPSTCQALALTADGAMLASGHFDGALRFWDLRRLGQAGWGAVLVKGALQGAGVAAAAACSSRCRQLLLTTQPLPTPGPSLTPRPAHLLTHAAAAWPMRWLGCTLRTAASRHWTLAAGAVPAWLAGRLFACLPACVCCSSPPVSTPSPPPHAPPAPAYPFLLCSGTLVLSCGKDNLLRCVDVRRFEVRGVTPGRAPTLGSQVTPYCSAALRRAVLRLALRRVSFAPEGKSTIH